LCGKIFTSSGGRTCPACHARLDEIYPRVRQYLRDNPKVNFNVEMVAEALDTDIRDIQSLVDMGYLDRDIGRQTDPETLKRQKLAQEFESSLQQMKEASAMRGSAKNAAASYGQHRYGEKDKKKG
jgi:hypothetical protein